MLTNRTLGAAEAAEWDWSRRWCPTANSTLPPTRWRSRWRPDCEAGHAVKKLLLMSFGNGLEEQLEYEARLIGQCADSPDGREGWTPSLNKRAPGSA